MGALIGVGAKVVLAGALGFGLRKSGFVSSQLASDLGKLLISVIAPIAILAAACRPYSNELAGTLGTATVISVAYFTLAIVVAWTLMKLLPVELSEGRVFVLLTTFPNMTFIGIPIVTELYGTAGLLCAVVGNLMFNLVFFSFGEAYMGTTGKISVKALVKSPVLMACVLAIIIFFSRIPVPSALVGGLDMIGAAMAPVAMMIVGFGLAESYLGQLIRKPLGYLASFLRLIFWPLVVLSVTRLLGMDHLAANVMAVLFGLPCGTMTVVLAARNRVAYHFAAGAVVQSNVLMFATMPFIYWLINTWV